MELNSIWIILSNIQLPASLKTRSSLNIKIVFLTLLYLTPTIVDTQHLTRFLSWIGYILW